MIDSEQWLQDCDLVDCGNLRKIEEFLGDDAFGVIEDFVTDAASHVARLQESGLGKDELLIISHTLKSSAANIGAMRLSLLAKEVEHLLRAGEEQKAKELLPIMPQLWGASLIEIRQEIDSLRQ